MESRFYPKTDNFGENCLFWSTNEGCLYQKAELLGRRTCEGLIDDVCLFVMGVGKIPDGMSDEEANRIKNHPAYSGINLPPGNIESL